MGEITVRSIKYKGYGNCIEVSNGIVEILVTVDFGPRIIKYGFHNERNEFCERPDENMKVGNDTWYIRGGHRLWHSPENDPRTYWPDNSSVEWQRIDGGIKVVQNVEPWVQIKKEIEITLNQEDSGVKVAHKLTNENAWPIELSAWAVTMMAPGGFEIIPMPDSETGLLPNRMIALWPYAKMNDTRVKWGDKYIILKQNPDMKQHFKLGITNEHGWAAYYNNGNMFVKKFAYSKGARYPDFGVSYESYTSDTVLEMESLSPLETIEPHKEITYDENWKLIKVKDIDAEDENGIHQIVLTSIL
jgi:hypothetical protein